jgi:uncharacterized membrane protein
MGMGASDGMDVEPVGNRSGVVHAFILGAVIVGIVLGIRWLIGQGKTSQSDGAVEIFRQRYARGEIDKDEF